MVAEAWILKMSNQVSSNFRHALYLDSSTKSSNKKQGPQERQIIGILSFEVAKVMSKIVNLHKSLTDHEILKLKNEILKFEGIKTLVSDDEKQLLELALVEKLDDFNRIASAVSRLGKKCTIPALQGFEHVFGDIVSGVIDIKELGFLVKDMESMVRKMERYVNTMVNLYREMEVLNELEGATKKFQQNQLEESRKAFEQKLTWQKQDVRHLKDASLWNQTYDKVVELLARTVCTVYARIYVVFGDHSSNTSSMLTSRSQYGFSGSLRSVKQDPGRKSGHLDLVNKVRKDTSLRKSLSAKSNGYGNDPGRIVDEGLEKKSINFGSKVGLQKSEGGLFGPEDFNFVCGIGPGRLFMECLSLSSSGSEVEDDDHVSYDCQSSQVLGCFGVASNIKRDNPTLSNILVHPINGDPLYGETRQFKRSSVKDATFGPKSSLLVYAPPNSVGGSALALHYANVIIVIEKLLKYPHLVGDEARHDLYQMLPTSLRRTLKANLKSYTKDLAIYDAPLAHDWKEKLDSMLKWLSPLAHNMIRWQTERNVEQQQIVTRTNALLLQTLYFADRKKTEEAISDLLVGLNYICRYEQQQNALWDCASSFNLEDGTEWQFRVRASSHS
ncbi:UNVERIFIED_CONTAM: hypothetical protein Sradi_3591100 [Sesamum radiatum]|uniref:Uncharacterized protein n=1 Tax=Sesamum radiatum TaxID=300843 RepID=A0AAW2QGN3_SESRA